ncbi:MAG: hypothetical protein K0U68_03475 [Gammaproteobacteria bacterium]|nr:hypothetical protein [Gammaproteobacteria bacterium]
MKTDELETKLSKLDRSVLQNFILDLYQHHPGVSDSIETLVLYNDPPELKKAIAKRIQSVKRGRKFIDWAEVAGFAQTLESIVNDIEQGLLDTSPEYAFELIDKLLVTAAGVMNRVDDSSGEIGEIYLGATILWLHAAKAWNDKKTDWLERVYQLYQKNDFGVYDSLLPNSHVLFDKQQLQQLADRYETELLQSLKNNDSDQKLNMDALMAQVALSSVAEALQDPQLYEHSIVLNSPDPNDLQKKEIVAMYLRFQQLDGAMRWLDTEWDDRFKSDRLHLLEQVYQQNGDTEQLREIRYQIYQDEGTYHNFQRYLETLNPEQQQAARQTAIIQAEQGRNLVNSADLLFQLGEHERAQQFIINHYNDLQEVYYTQLSWLVKTCEQANCPLATTACYRALLLDILNRGKSKAYNYAARYFKKLDALACEINDFTPLIDHRLFLSQLKAEHGKKRSFWEKVKN